MALHRAVEPVLDRPPGSQFTPDGWIGQRVRASEDNWLIPAPSSNPGMVEMFAHKGDLRFVNGPFASLPTNDWRNPLPVPWAGEFAGKYLISAIQSLQMTRRAELAPVVAGVVQGLVAAQVGDGSLGLPLAWDLWGQYHVMLGLLRWYEFTGSMAALAACTRAADLAVARYLDRPSAIALDHPADDEKNQAVAHVLVLLYEQTGGPQYLQLAHQIEAEWKSTRCLDRNPDNPDWEPHSVQCGNFIDNALNGVDFFRGTRPRWESLHDVQAIAEFYFVTGDSTYRSAFEQIWWNLRMLERHPDGGFGAGEATNGDPYSPRYVETCATVAWMALSIDMLRVSGESIAADELELSLFNATLAAQSPDGRLWTYHTPVGGAPTDTADPPAAYLGYRLPAHYDLDWQQRDRYPQLSCCAANGPRALGCLSEWAVMTAADAVIINFYGPSTTSVAAPDGTWITLSQHTGYPADGAVSIDVVPAVPSHFAIRLRIPEWSTAVSLQVNGQQWPCTPGSYCEISRVWVPHDVIALTLDMSVRVVEGAREASGRVAVYRGPLLLSYDARLNREGPLEAAPIRVTEPTDVSTGTAGGAVVVTFLDSHGGTASLCDYASAGQSTAGMLTARPDPTGPWQFSRSNGEVIAPRIMLMPDGSVSGYSHDNEASWGFEGDDLTFYARNGAPSTRFTTRSERNGLPVLSGVLLLDRSIRHILSQVEDDIVGKTWQFWRRTDDTVLRSPLRLRADGTFDGPTHPNESRWAVADGRLTFYDANGTPSTRFEPPLMTNGRAEYTGQFLFDASITHVLSEIDLEVIGKVWRFWRIVTGVPDTVIDDKVRLLPNHGVDGHRHSNETRWGTEGNDVAFYGADGSVTTRFTTMRSRGSVMVYEGTFALDPAITHRLEERAAGYPLGGGYVSWLVPAPSFAHQRIHR